MKRFLPFLLAPALVFAAGENAGPFAPKVERLDPTLDELIAPDAQVEKLAEGIHWAEGPVWIDGALLFSDVPENTMYRWSPGETGVKVFLKPSGGMEATPDFREPGSNGLAKDAGGRLIFCQQGSRRIARLEKDGSQTALANSFEGKHFNSPNDVIVRSNGDIYFTDPPYGLAGGDKSPLKEMAFHGVFRIAKGGGVSLLTKELQFPNGIAFSPDEKTLYIGVTDDRTRIMAYDVKADGAIENGRVFFDAMPLRGPDRPGACDGMKVDRAGNLWASGPGGILIISPQGRHLGTIAVAGNPIANCAWGDDGSTLYMTANHFLCRLKTKTKGAGW